MDQHEHPAADPVARRRHRRLGTAEERHHVDDEHRPPTPLGRRCRLRRHLRRGPWLEFVPAPDSDTRRVWSPAFDGMGDRSRRAFKTHSAPPELPYHPPDQGPTCGTSSWCGTPTRRSRRCVRSSRAHSDAWFDLWQVPKEAIVGPDFATFFSEMASPMVGDDLRVRRRVVASAPRTRTCCSCTSPTSSASTRHRCAASPSSSAST